MSSNDKNKAKANEAEVLNKETTAEMEKIAAEGPSESEKIGTTIESISSSPVTSETEAEEYVTEQTFSAATEHELQALIAILDGESPTDRKSILKALVRREKLKEAPANLKDKKDASEDELNEDWRKGGYPYKNRMSRKLYEKEKYQIGRAHV